MGTHPLFITPFISAQYCFAIYKYIITMHYVYNSRVAGQYVISMTLLSESVPMAKRNVLVLLVNSIFMLAQGLMAGEYKNLCLVDGDNHR